MAGFLVAWTRDGVPPDSTHWAKAQALAMRHGGQCAAFAQGRVALAAWHRAGGEFACSGKITQTGAGHLAWIGQCVDNQGDATAQAQTLVAAPHWEDAAVAHINGPFAAVVVSGAHAAVRVVTDRYRHYPIYLYRNSALTVASTDLRTLLPFMDRVQMDLDAVDMMLRCGELIDRMTLLQGVELLPPGTLLSDEGHGLVERRYWAMRHDGAQAGTLQDTAEDLATRLTTAVQRLEAVTPRLGITLSGGLDSRIILDLCKKPEQVPSFTWGLPGCRDIACATEYAALVKTPHTVKHWEPRAFPPVWSQGVDLTAGTFGVESMYMLPFVPLLANACDVVFNGLAGDAILGGNFIKHDWLGESDITRLGAASWRWRVSPAEDQWVNALMPGARGAEPAAQRWARSVAAREGARPIERLNDWLYENRVFRNTNAGTMLLRSGVESHAPFFDNDFIDAVTRVRQEHKFKHKLYLQVMRRAAPRAASATWQRTQLPPAWGYHANLAAMGLHRVVNALAGRLGFQAFKDLKVADPAAWLRGDWSSAVQGILFTPAALSRGLWNADVAQKLWGAHLSGANHTRQLGAMIAIELFAQQFVDGDAA